MRQEPKLRRMETKAWVLRSAQDDDKCLSENFLFNFNNPLALSRIAQSAGGQSELQTSSDAPSSRNQQAIQSAGDVFGRKLRIPYSAALEDGAADEWRMAPSTTRETGAHG